MVTYKSLIYFVCFSVCLISCKHKLSEVDPPSIKQDDPVRTETISEEPIAADSVNIYIAGAINVANNKWNASYWKNDSLIKLEEKHSIAHAILLHNGKVIVGGEREGKPCFWEDGKLTVINDKNEGKVNAIGVNNGQLYLVGSVYEDVNNFKAFVWKNGEMTFLNQYKGYATDISFRGNDVFISGMDSEKPCFWKNGEITILSDKFGHGYGIETTASDVYVVGEYRPTNSGYFLAGYWKNGTFISPVGNSVYVRNMGIKQNVVYLLGNKYLKENGDKAVFIRSNETIILGGEHTMSNASDIAFNGADEYVLGSCNLPANNDNSSHTCYWINNKQHIIKGKIQSQGSAIFLEKL